MFCINCGKKILDDSNFCEFCGTKIDAGNYKSDNKIKPLRQQKEIANKPSQVPIRKKWWFWVIVTFLDLSLLILGNDSLATVGFFGIFIIPIVFIFVILTPVVRNFIIPQKKCPFCQKKVSREQNECPHCHRTIMENIITQKKDVFEHIDVQKQSNIFQKLSEKKPWNKSWVRFVIFFVIIAILFFWQIEPAETFPSLEKPKTITFTWEYEGFKYAIEETLYETVYNYYRRKPKLNDCWLNSSSKKEMGDCYSLVFNIPEEDRTFIKISSDIKSLGQKKGLNEDQILELIIAFVQSIPYDEERLETIMSSEEYNASWEPRYPYEVLYDGKGVCSDKTYLAGVLIEQLGYGFAVFDFDYEGPIDHTGLGISCPIKYSSYTSGYCFVETTLEGSIIGIIPDLDPNTYMPLEMKELSLYSEQETVAVEKSEIKLEDYEIYEIEDGKSYKKIIGTFDTIKKMSELNEEMNVLYDEMKKLNTQIDSQESELNTLENDLDNINNELEELKNRMESNYYLYDLLMPQYNSLLDKYENKYNIYNRKYKIYKQTIDKYNQKVNSYNKLVKSYNKLYNEIFPTNE